MTAQKASIYSVIEERATIPAAQISRFNLGLTWSCCRVQMEASESIGFAMSPQEKTRLLEWPGTIAGKSVAEVAHLLESWNFFDATMALCACNAVINCQENQLLERAQLLPVIDNANLSVFAHFRGQMSGKKIVIVGRYPHIDKLLEGLDYTILERQPQPGDKPDSAAEYLIPEADWVFITATSLINKTFTRLAELAKNATTVLMGPTTPWLQEFAEFNVNYLAGVKVVCSEFAEQVAMEGGGTRLFDGGVQYAIQQLA